MTGSFSITLPAGGDECYTVSGEFDEAELRDMFAMIRERAGEDVFVVITHPDNPWIALMRECFARVVPSELIGAKDTYICFTEESE